MPFYSSVYQEKSQLDDALEKLEQHGFTNDAIQIITDFNKHSSVFPANYDPLGGARFAGTNLTTMAATGFNIIGNSTTVDVSIDKLPELLSELVETESMDGTKSAMLDELSPSFLLVVETDQRSIITNIITETGGIIVDIDNYSKK